jgi:transketolase
VINIKNNYLRKQIVDLAVSGQCGHIPSAFSIVDIISVLYRSHLKFNPKDASWEERDYFILSKGHGCLGLYVVLKEHGFLTEENFQMLGKFGSILGEHPDSTKVPGAEASTGSLGHGLSFALGVALGLRIKRKNNKVYVLVGDGECHEGTVWEAANVANNLQLGNLCVVVDWNGSAAQLMPKDDLQAKWSAFGWNTQVIDGHSDDNLNKAFSAIQFQANANPSVILARTCKGKGVAMLEGHGPWHHKFPNDDEYRKIMEALS